MAEPRNPGNEIKALEEKRQALEQAVRIALNIEHLHKSLEATLLLGEASADIPKEALTTFIKLDASTKGMPVVKLKESLAALEKVVRSKLGKILQIAEMDEQALLASDPAKIQVLLENYRKQAQTAVALRVLLHSRGEPSDATELRVPTAQIRAKLTVVTQKERAYRKVIKTEITSMMKETERMLTNPGLNDKMREFLVASNQDLQMNLDHLDSGQSITTMPVAIEMVEMSENEITSLDTAPSESLTQPSQIPEVQKQTLFAPLESVTPEIAPQQAKKKKKGFFQRLKEWATTPDEVTWKKTRSRK